MKLCCPVDMPDDVMALCCRQSRLVGMLQAVVWCVALSLPPILGWSYRLWWVFWIGVIVATLCFPLIVKNMLLLFRATNWVARIGRNGVWINLLSYRDTPSSAPSIVHLDYDELAGAGKHVQRYSTPSETARATSPAKISGSTQWRSEFLEIQLRQPQTDELQRALNHLRSQPAGSGEPAQSSSNVSRPYPVWITSPTVIRIPWLSGHAHAVLPRLAYALDQLGPYVSIAAPTQRDWPDWRKLTPDEAHELACELVILYGDDLAATNLLVRAAGLTGTEALTLTRRFAQDGK